MARLTAKHKKAPLHPLKDGGVLRGTTLIWSALQLQERTTLFQRLSYPEVRRLLPLTAEPPAVATLGSPYRVEPRPVGGLGCPVSRCASQAHSVPALPLARTTPNSLGLAGDLLALFIGCGLCGPQYGMRLSNCQQAFIGWLGLSQGQPEHPRWDRHARESGHPGAFPDGSTLDPRFRGGDGDGMSPMLRDSKKDLIGWCAYVSGSTALDQLFICGPKPQGRRAWSALPDGLAVQGYQRHDAYGRVGHEGLLGLQ